MPLLNNIVSSIKTGWVNLNNDDNLTMLTFLSVTYVFLIFLNYPLLSDSIFSGYVLIFGTLSMQGSTLFVGILALSSCISLFIGALFSERYHPRLHLISTIAGLIFSFSLYLPLQGESWIFFYALTAGVVSTIGLSNVVAAFLSKTDFSNRGSTSGIFTFLVYIVLFVFTMLVGQLRELAIVLVILKIFSLFLCLRVKEFKFDNEKTDYVRTSSRIKLSFILIWAIFIISNVAVNVYLEDYIMVTVHVPEDVVFTISIASRILGLFTIFIGGIMMDVYGRKKLMMASYAYLGANYAVISFSTENLYWFTVLDGIAWGILTVMFMLVLWGDLCKPSKRTVWLAASLSLSILMYPALVIAPHVVTLFAGSMDMNDLFPLTSFFLFIAVVIILYLPETLPEKIIQKKELEDYIHMAKKVKQKYKKVKS